MYKISKIGNLILFDKRPQEKKEKKIEEKKIQTIKGYT
jgi:hypothetical protein